MKIAREIAIEIVKNPYDLVIVPLGDIDDARIGFVIRRGGEGSHKILFQSGLDFISISDVADTVSKFLSASLYQIQGTDDLKGLSETMTHAMIESIENRMALHHVVNTRDLRPQ